VPVISMMTDFGIKDGNVGVMKSVIWNISPEARISDLSHMVQPQNIREAALLLARSAPYFPENSIHLCVVDPGVGTARRPMAARIGTQYYVGPDNGSITMLLEKAEQAGWKTEFFHLNNPDYWLPEVSFVFHGRDIFSPVAAHISIGVPLKSLGIAFDDPVRLELPKPQKTGNIWQGEVIHIDHFGNISSNILMENLGDALKEKEKITVRVHEAEIEGLVDTFGQGAVGELVALLGSTGNLIVSVVNGSACERLQVEIGDPFQAVLN
jgi:S-adenosyl-L-methionine hydrolase (adenosine-forming)